MQQYSLLERFHGALLGPAIAAQYCVMGPDAQPHIQPAPSDRCLQWLCHPAPAPPPLSGDSLSDCLMLLPLWLYSHESWRQRLSYLQQLSAWAQPNTDQAALWLYGEAIAHVIRPNCNLANLAHNLQQRWHQHAASGAPACPDQWQAQLDQLQPSSALSQLHPLSQCLKIFLDSPQDLTIALQRIDQQASPHRRIMAQLSAALIGTYCGWSQFPTQAIADLGRGHRPIATSIEETHALVSDESMVPYTIYSHQLLEAWSGILVPKSPQASISSYPIVLTPR